MKHIIITAICLLLSLTATARSAQSPNGRIKVELKNGRYVVTCQQQTVLSFSAGNGTPIKGSPRHIKTDYTMLSGKRLVCTNEANEYRCGNLLLRLYNDGIAFRTEGLSSLRDEQTVYHIADGTRRWIQKWVDSYEGFFPLTTTATDGRWGYPALIEPADGLFALLTESNIERTQSASSLYSEGQQYRVVPDECAPAATAEGCHTPWRVLIVGTLADVVQSTLVTDVADPCRLDDTSWIKPGVVSWIYWAYNHGSNDYNIICKYVDMAVALRLPYVLIDAEWDEMKDGKTIEDAVAYARQKGVRPLIWYNSSVGWVNGAPGPKFRLNKAEDREREFAWCERIGVAGVKIDFFSGDNQQNMDYCIDLLESAARHHLLVNFHGATVPRGWQRTWPNLLSTEGVYGAEWYNNVPTFTDKAARHNATLPFTRNVIGPMDYTPCTFSDSQHPHITTHAHELALTVLYESGLQHLADRPESYLAQPQAVQQFFSDLPAAWDETRLLSGYPGEQVVIARRRGTTWYVAGINGRDEQQTLQIPLSFIPQGVATLFADGDPWAISHPTTLPTTITCKPRGGFVLVVQKTTTKQAQVYLNPQAPIEERISDALSRMTTHEKISVLHAQSKFTSAGVPRLGIRQLTMDDGPHGVREELEWNSWSAAKWTNDSVVAFPSLTCLAATWNPALSALYGNAVSEEFAFRGKDIMLGPGVNIQRTPLNGRAFEYMGEDPVLAAEMVVPYIQAVQHNGVACCLKHFALNNQETDRFSVNVNVSERAMREIYLYPFEQAVKRAHVYTIMGSYNLWQNVHCSHNDALLNKILKQEWGFDGALVSDWNAVTDTWQAATGGLDIEMGTEPRGQDAKSNEVYRHYYMADPLERMVEEGRVPMSVIDEKVRRVLRTIFRTAMNPAKAIGSQCSEAHYDACRQIAEEGIVLLKNAPAKKGAKPLLPLDPSRYTNILVVGENATRSLTQGGGSSELKTLHDVSPLDALRAQLTSPLTSSPSPLTSSLTSPHSPLTSLVYHQGYASGRALYDKVDKVSPEQSARLKAEALEQARQADLIIYVGGLNKNHKQDCENGDRASFDLSFGQNELIAELAAIQPNIVVVTFGGNPYAMPWIDQVAALVHCWYLGSESGTALTNVLTGKTTPSGKLPVTFARHYEDYPYVKYGQEAYPGVDKQVYYKEDVFVGYRGFERDKRRPLFPFGFGLSYTTFQYGKPAASVQGDSIAVTLTITNSGPVAGKETAQLYVSAPKSKLAERPLKELKAFAKTRLLQPGEQQTLRITFAKSALATWDDAAHNWSTTPGTYTLLLGASSTDIRGKSAIDL
jgi:beta-glucosidase